MSVCMLEFIFLESACLLSILHLSSPSWIPFHCQKMWSFQTTSLLNIGQLNMKSIKMDRRVLHLGSFWGAFTLFSVCGSHEDEQMIQSLSKRLSCWIIFKFWSVNASKMRILERFHGCVIVRDVRRRISSCLEVYEAFLAGCCLCLSISSPCVVMSLSEHVEESPLFPKLIFAFPFPPLEVARGPQIPYGNCYLVMSFIVILIDLIWSV